MQTSPLVSVVIPTYNYATFLDEALESLYRQTYKNLEIIVVDDGSTDETERVVTKHKSKIKFFRQNNLGPSAARNSGIEQASGTFLQFLDADDYLSSNAIESKVSFLKRKEDARICYSRVLSFYELPNGKRKYEEIWNLPDFADEKRALYFFNIAPPHAFLCHLEDLKRFDIRFDEELRFCEDYDFWFKLAVSTSYPRQIQKPSCIAFHREHKDSLTNDTALLYNHDAILINRIFENLESGQIIRECRRNEALTLLFHASLITFRRLHTFKTSDALNFLDSTILNALLPALLAEPFDRSVNLDLARHRLQIRTLLYKLFYKERSIDIDTFEQVINKLMLTASAGTSAAISGNYAFFERCGLCIADVADLMRRTMYTYQSSPNIQN